MSKNWIYRAEIVLSSGTTLHVATTGYTVPPSHATLAGRFIPGRLKQPLLFRRDFFGARKLFGDPEIAHGTVTLNNADGGLDAYLAGGIAVDTRAYTLYRVDPDDRVTERLEHKLYMESMTGDTKEINILVRDLAYVFDREVQPLKFLGNNVLPAGVEGDTNLKDKEVPIGWGQNWNVELICVNTSKGIYKFHDYGMGNTWAMTLMDKRSVVTMDGAGNYANVAAMEATAPTAGQYRVCPTDSMLRFNGTPTGKLTLDFNNPCPGLTMAGGGSRWYTIFNTLMNRIGSYQIANVITDGSGNYDYDIGVYWKDKLSQYEAFRDIVRNVAGTIQSYPATGGPFTDALFLQALNVNVPSGSPHLTLTESNVVKDSLKLVQAGGSDRGIPPYKVNVGYQRNRTVQTLSELAGVALSDVAFTSQEYRFVSETEAITQTIYPAAPEYTQSTNIPDSTNAAALAYNLKWTILSPPTKRMFEVACHMRFVEDLNTGFNIFGGPGPNVYGPFLNMQVKLTHRRFSLSTGPTLTTIGYQLDYAKRQVNFTLWGMA